LEKHNDPGSRRGSWALAALLLVLAPLALLGPSVFGDRTYVPFDMARFTPKSLLLTESERAVLDDPRTPENTDVTEIPALVVPEMQLARQQWAEGSFPGWNPSARFGAPLFANGLAGMAYPPNTLLLMGFDPVDGLVFTTWLGFALASLLTLALLRRLGLGPGPAALGALVFALGGTLATNAPFYMRLHALAWLPGMLLAILRLADRDGRGRALPAAGLAVSVAGTLMAGFPPFAVACLVVAGLWSTPVLLRRCVERGPVAGLSLAAWTAGSVLLGAALAGVQLAPMFAFYPESNRQVAPSLAQTLSECFDPLGFLGFVMPTAVGEPSGLPRYEQSPLAYLLWSGRDFDSGRLQFPHTYNFTEYAVFLGSLPFLLALLGAVRARRPALRWAAVCALALAVLAVAPHALAPFYRLPVVASVPPLRYVGPLSLLLAILAASGLQRVLARDVPKTAVTIAGLGFLVACAGFWIGATSPLGETEAVRDALAARYGVPPASVRGVIPDAAMHAASDRLDSAGYAAGIGFLLASTWLLLAVLARPSRGWNLTRTLLAFAFTGVELLLFAYPTNTGRVLVDDPDRTPIQEFLLERDEALADQGGLTLARAAQVVRDPVDLPSGTLFPLGLRDLNAYAFVDAWSWRVFEALYGKAHMIRRYWPRTFPDDPRLERPFFDLVGLRYVVTTDELSHAGVPVGPTVEGPDGRALRIYERPGALPRAFFVHARRRVADDDEAIEALLAEDLDPGAAVLMTDADLDALSGHPPDDRPAVPRTVRFAVDRSDRIVLEIGAGPAGDLILCDAALSGWSATVDGASTPTARGNLFMRVIPVATDAQTVELRYAPPGLTVGIAASGAGCAVLIALLFAAYRSRRTALGSDVLGAKSRNALT
jgi:hypothetical protein